MMRRNLVELVIRLLFSWVMASAKRSSSRMPVWDSRGKVLVRCASITSRYSCSVGCARVRDTTRLLTMPRISVMRMAMSRTRCTVPEKANSVPLSTAPTRIQCSSQNGALRLYSTSGSSAA